MASRVPVCEAYHGTINFQFRFWSGARWWSGNFGKSGMASRVPVCEAYHGTINFQFRFWSGARWWFGNFGKSGMASRVPYCLTGTEKGTEIKSLNLKKRKIFNVRVDCVPCGRFSVWGVGVGCLSEKKSWKLKKHFVRKAPFCLRNKK